MWKRWVSRDRALVGALVEADKTSQNSQRRCAHFLTGTSKIRPVTRNKSDNQLATTICGPACGFWDCHPVIKISFPDIFYSEHDSDKTNGRADNGSHVTHCQLTRDPHDPWPISSQSLIMYGISRSRLLTNEFTACLLFSAMMCNLKFRIWLIQWIFL